DEVAPERGGRRKTALTVPATAGLRDSISWKKAVRRRMKARFGAKSRGRWRPEEGGCLVGRFYPVQSFFPDMFLWPICHNGKGKAKGVIILMNLLRCLWRAGPATTG